MQLSTPFKKHYKEMQKITIFAKKKKQFSALIIRYSLRLLIFLTRIWELHVVCVNALKRAIIQCFFENGIDAKIGEVKVIELLM